jgi:DNA-binding transcriptional MerR regulator
VNERKFFRAGELARLTRVSTDTLRYYEREGLILRPARSANRYREYSADTLQRVRVIQAALAIGFSVKELARIFHKRDHGGVPCREARDLAIQKLEMIELQLKHLQKARTRLRSVIQSWKTELNGHDPSVRVHLLDKLASDKSIPLEHFPRLLQRAKQEKRK